MTSCLIRWKCQQNNPPFFAWVGLCFVVASLYSPAIYAIDLQPGEIAAPLCSLAKSPRRRLE